jgi:hypothetical protein
MVWGARAGAAIAPFTGPAAPFMPAVGAVLGGGTGWLLGQELDSLFPGVQRQDLVPYREGGKTFGGAIASAPFAFNLPVLQGGRVAKFVTGIGEGARKYPKSYLVGETMGATGSGLLGGTAVAYAPDSPSTRLVGEIVGGFLSPGRFFASSAGAVKELGSTAMGSFASDVKQAKAANKLVTILEESGEDIPRLIRELEKNLNIPQPTAGQQVGPTAAQKTASPALSVIETTLGRSNPIYAAAIRKQGLDTLQAYELLVESLQKIGTPQALKAAAETRRQMFDNLLNTRLQSAEVAASERINRISQDTPAARVEIGQIVQQKTEEALRDARLYEKTLWLDAYRDTLKRKTVQGETTLVPRNVIPENTGRSALEIATSMSPERFNSLPTEVRQIMGRLGVDQEAIAKFAAGRRTQDFIDTGVVPDEYVTKAAGPRTTKRESVFARTDVEDLINIRSDLLDFARNASVRGEVANSGFYSKLADGVLRDLEGMRLPNYDKARDFSRTLNDFFTRSFAGEVSKGTNRGVQQYAPEILVQRAFGAANDVTALRMRDIEDAVGMMRTQYDEAVAKFGVKSRQAQALKPMAELADQNVTSIRDAQTRAYRLAAAKSIDPATGRVNERMLLKFVNENKPMLDRLQITDDLSSAARAENAYRALQTETSRINTILNNQKEFARLVSYDNPTDAITDILNSKNPVRGMANLVRMTTSDKLGGPAAQAGLKSSIYDYAFTKAGGEKGFSPAAFQKIIFEPLAPGQPSLFSMMRSQGIMTISEGKNLRAIIAPMEKVELALKNQQITDDIVQGADAITEIALRIGGSKLGAALGGNNSLIAMSAGSKYMRDIFDKSPMILVRGIIEDATKDPQLMAQLLKRGKTEAEKFQMARNMHSYLISAGLNYGSFDESKAPPKPTNYWTIPGPNPNYAPPVIPQPAAPRIPFRSDSQQMLRQLPPAPATRGVPGMSTPAAPGAKPPAGQTGQAPMSGSSRAAFQALFPMDSVASLMNQGGEGGAG